MKIIIIGNSAASTAAIEAIRKYDRKSSIVQLSDESYPLYSRCLLTYYLAGIINKKGLLYRKPDFHKKTNVDLNLGKRVVEVDPNRQRIACGDGSSYEYDKLLISTGSLAKIPPNIPKNIDGVFVLRTITHAQAIKKKIHKAKSAVILGGGLIAMRAAYALNRCRLKVTVIVRSNRILSQMIDYEAAQVVKKRLLETGIEVLEQTDVSEILTKDNKLVAIKTDNGKTISCEFLIVAKGVKPNIELIQNSDIAKRQGIITNPYMQTNYKNIFAAGDVAETFDLTTEDYALNALWTCAVEQGRAAGLNIIEKRAQYDGSLGMNSLNFFNIPLISFGITSPENETKYKILIDTQPERNIYKKIIIKNGCIKGLILVEKIDNAGVLLSLIKNKINVSSFENELLSDQFNFGKLLKYCAKPVLKKYYNGLA